MWTWWGPGLPKAPQKEVPVPRHQGEPPGGHEASVQALPKGEGEGQRPGGQKPKEEEAVGEGIGKLKGVHVNEGEGHEKGEEEEDQEGLHPRGVEEACEEKKPPREGLHQGVAGGDGTGAVAAPPL